MKAFFCKHSVHILMIVLELCIGILLLIQPVRFTKGILMALGIVLALLGIWSAVRYFMAKPQEGRKTYGLARGLGLLMAGCFCALDVQWFVDTFPVLAMLYGLLMLLGGLYKAQDLADSLRLKTGNLLLKILSAVLTFVFSAVVFFNPFSQVSALWVFTGIALIALAAVDTSVIILGRRKPAAAPAEEGN